MMRNDSVVRVNAWRQLNPQIFLTIVFQLIGSTKLLMTPAKVSAMTLVRPTIVGSLAIHASQALHGASLQVSSLQS